MNCKSEENEEEQQKQEVYMFIRGFIRNSRDDILTLGFTAKKRLECFISLKQMYHVKNVKYIDI